ncbi:MAG: DUF3021 family protein [Tissierellia bacterium]|nr:DUF3021 family protein [Tissierellia bacterium]
MIKKGIIRGLIPLVIMTIISAVLKFQGVAEGQVRGTFVAGLISTTVVATSVLYEVEEWSLTKQSAAHFVAMLATVYPLLLISGWFELNGPADYLKILGYFILTGAVLWTIAYLIFGIIVPKIKK